MFSKVVASTLLVVSLAVGASQPLHAAQADRSVEALAERLVAQLAEPGPQAAAEIRERIDAGVPPGALVVWLDAYRGAPRSDLLDVVSSLAGYRRVEVRGRALAALAANEGAHAVAAIEQAAADADPTIRRLALGLAQRHPSATADEIVRRLIASDPALASEANDGTPEVAAVPDAEPAPREGTDEVVVVEDES